MDFPVIIPDVLPVDVFYNLQEDIKYLCYEAQSRDNTPIFWGIDADTCKNTPSLDLVTSYVTLKITRHSNYHVQYKLRKVNGATANMAGSTFHPDVIDESSLSFVLYTAPHWDTQWGGETVIQKPDGSYFYSPYVPNYGVLFPSHWEHYGASPNAHCPNLRTSIGFVYELCYNRPIATP